MWWCSIFKMWSTILHLYQHHALRNGSVQRTKELIITDRPNPCDYIGRRACSDVRLKSFVSMHPIPVCNGCTVGLRSNDKRWRVAGGKTKMQSWLSFPVKGWKHGDSYPSQWNPSPNLPNDQAIALYPRCTPSKALPSVNGSRHLSSFSESSARRTSNYLLPIQTEALRLFLSKTMYKGQLLWNMKSLLPP